MIKCPECNEELKTTQRQVCDMSLGHPEFYHIPCYNEKFGTNIPDHSNEQSMEDICENCGKKSPRLYARDMKDEKGRPIVQMVCAKCLKTSKKNGGKA